jgi:uncharacterized protein YceK
MKPTLVGYLFLPLLTACTTISTLGEDETRNKIYSGTARQFELKCAHGTCLDFPFSLVADTVLLPVTIPWTIVNLRGEDETDSGEDSP